MAEVAKELSQNSDLSRVQPQELQLKWLKSGSIEAILELSKNKAPIDPSPM